MTTAPGWIPAAEYPHDRAAISASRDRLAARYPNDPRAHVLAGVARLQHHDDRGAEAQYRTALSLMAGSPVPLAPSMEATLRGMLALVISDQRRRAEAIPLAVAACQATGSAAPSPEVARLLAKAALCGSGAPAL